MAKMTIQKLQKDVADQIISMMEQDGLEWVQRWRTPHPSCNGLSGHVYKGSNVFTTAIWLMCNDQTDPRFIPRGQLFGENAVGKIRKGEKGIPIVVYGTFLKENEKGDEERRSFGRIHWVWHVSQLDDLDESRLISLAQATEPQTPGERDAAIDLYIQNTGAIINDNATAAFYRPANDSVNMPPLETFYAVKGITAVEFWYSTVLHELIHWTGAPHRLNRDKKYHTKEGRAFEELIAEIGSVIAGMKLSVQPAPREDNAAYVQSWIQHLKDDPSAIFKAASAASAAVQHMDDLQDTLMVIEEDAA